MAPLCTTVAGRFVSAAGTISTATNCAAASRNFFFHAKNWPLLRPRSLQNAATLCPLVLLRNQRPPLSPRFRFPLPHPSRVQRCAPLHKMGFR